jgi:hypothetical protein
MPCECGIQYAAAFRFNRWRLWNTGSPAFAGDDSESKRPHSGSTVCPGSAISFAPSSTRAQGKQKFAEIDKDKDAGAVCRRGECHA